MLHKNISKITGSTIEPLRHPLLKEPREVKEIADFNSLITGYLSFKKLSTSFNDSLAILHAYNLAIIKSSCN